ncbi:MAG: Glycosyl transferase group 1 [Thermoanaerobacterium thermosaccharolyticum]|jgi:glycosyltransferase involved in cell wall biosynthesis
MKIAINASILDDKPSGLGIYTYNVIKELTNIVGNDDELFIYTSCTNLFKEQKNIKIKNVPQNTQPKYGKSAAIKRFIWTQFNLKKDILKENVNILYSTTHHGLLSFDRQIITVHDLLPLYFNYKDSLQRILQSNYFKYFLPRILKKTKKIITISDCTKKDMIKFFRIEEEKIVRIYNGYDDKEFYFRNKAYEYIFSKYKIKKYLLAIGASYPHKNYERFLQAAKIVKDKGTHNFSIIIAGGKKEYQESLKKLSQEMGLYSEIRFIDYVSQEDLPYLYSAAQCLVYPSLYEGFGLPPLEAMACGCPVITSNTSSLPEVVGDAGIMVVPYDVNEIAKAIDLVLSNENLRKEMIEKGLKQAKKFSWRKTAEEILKVYEDVYKETFGGR